MCQNVLLFLEILEEMFILLFWKDYIFVQTAAAALFSWNKLYWWSIRMCLSISWCLWKLVRQVAHCLINCGKKFRGRFHVVVGSQENTGEVSFKTLTQDTRVIHYGWWPDWQDICWWCGWFASFEHQAGQDLHKLHLHWHADGEECPHAVCLSQAQELL